VLRFNGDTGNNYQWQFGRVANTTLSGLAQVAQASLLIGSMPTASTHVGSTKATIFNYRDTALFKGVISESMRVDGTAAGNQARDFDAGEWLSAAAINAVQVLCDSGANFVNGAVVSLYGRL
jgi:hypothetical protein